MNAAFFYTRGNPGIPIISRIGPIPLRSGLKSYSYLFLHIPNRPCLPCAILSVHIVFVGSRQELTDKKGAFIEKNWVDRRH